VKPIKKFWKDLKKDVRSKEGLTNAAKFVFVFLVSFLLFYFILIPLTAPVWVGLGEFNAFATHNVLSTMGVPSEVSGNMLTVNVRGEDIDFVISQLCSGDIEIALLVSLLIASLDVLLVWRILGSLIGIGFILLMNPLRIALTIWITTGTDLQIGDFYHNVMFRLFLFILLVFYYFLWYRVFKNREGKLRNRVWKGLGF
jgi:exosortase/archaeosortase family protein